MNKKFPKYFLKRFNRKAVLFIFFAFFAFSILLFPNNKKAQAWDAAPANIMLFGMEKIEESIQKTIIASAKMEAAVFVGQELDNTLSMITGERGVLGVVNGFVEDWEAFLIEEPGNQAAAYLEEFLFNATGGRSSSNYRSKVGKSNARYSMNFEGFGSNETIHYGLIRTASVATSNYYEYEDGGAAYREKLKKINEALKDEKKSEWSIATEEPNYERNPRLMFAKNNLRDFDLYLSGINNPWSYEQYKNMKMENNYQQKKAELSLRVLIGKGIYDGDIGTAVSEATVKDYYDTMDLKLLEGAQSLPETVAYTALVKVNKVLKKSIRNVRKSYQKDLAAYRSQIMTSFSANFTGARPQDVFKQQIQDRQERQNKFGTGANYENINVDAEIRQRESLKNRTLTTGQIQER